MALETWLAFFVACWVISLSPGAGAIASMSAGLQYGFVRGYWNALGLQLGLALQIAIVAAGVGAILAASELAFSLIKWFGVVYLVYLGYRQWQALPSDMTAQTERPIGRPLTHRQSPATAHHGYTSVVLSLHHPYTSLAAADGQEVGTGVPLHPTALAWSFDHV